MKGRVAEGVQLTVGYDSDRPADQRVMRDLDTQRGYLVAGDASVVGYDAQSAGRLYARLERRDIGLDVRQLGHAPSEARASRTRPGW